MAFKESAEAEPESESLGSVDAWLDEHLLQKEQGVAHEPTPLLRFLAAKHEARRAVRRSKVQAQKKPTKAASGARGKADTVRLVVVRDTLAFLPFLVLFLLRPRWSSRHPHV